MNRDESELCRWHTISDERALQPMAMETILASAARTIRERGQSHLVLAGENTSREIYRELCAAKTDWSTWHIYFDDERCLPLDDQARNSLMAAGGWLDQISILLLQLYVIPKRINGGADLIDC